MTGADGSTVGSHRDGIMGSCEECSFKIHQQNVEKRVQMLAGEGVDDDLDDVARKDARNHSYVCDGEINWFGEWAEIMEEDDDEN